MSAVAETTEIRASARYVRCSPRKARLVADQIRGKSVIDAQALLAYSPRAAATPVRKVLQSAIANADHNAGWDPTDLVLSTIMVDEGPTLRRFRPRAQGRATRINKRTCHISVSLTPVEGARRSRRAAAPAEPAAQSTQTATASDESDE